MLKLSQSWSSVAKVKYYAIRVGRQGPRIYRTWDECKADTQRYPGAIHKGFPSRTEAEAWLYESQPNSRQRPLVDMTRNPTKYAHANYHSGDMPVTTGTSTNTTTTAKGRIVGSPVPFTTLNSNEEQDAPALLSSSQPAASPASASSPSFAAQDIPISPEQERILDMVEEGMNVFFTGSAGTGKSVTLHKIIAHLRHKKLRRALAVTASTGIASDHIGGTTLHSWAGIDLGDAPVDILKAKVAENKSASRRWKRVRTLIIDEISMIDGKLLDKLEEIARYIRNNDLPFGGIQLVLSGDFYQLPPVPGLGEDDIEVPPTFAFDSDTWKKCIGRPVFLTKVFRQRDPTFVNILNAMRVGELGQSETESMRTLSREVEYEDGIGPTELFPTRREVDESNAKCLAQIQEDEHVYSASDSKCKDEYGIPITDERMERLLNRLIARKKLTLKVGAQVMLIKNLKYYSLFNGSVGRVIGFCTYHNHIGLYSATNVAVFYRSSQLWPIVEFAKGQKLLCTPSESTVNNVQGSPLVCRKQVPLILAWALSVHKSQGQALERVRVDLARIFETGQAYVALSRATSMDTLEVRNFDPAKVKAHRRVLEWYREMETSGGRGSEDGDVAS